MAWLSGWSYRKEISITGQSGAGTDFQVLFDIGDSAGGDFHLEGHCTNFPQDIEVTDNDGTTLLKFWIEDLTADPLEMSVKVADDLGSNQTIYVYYGKSGATTNSNGPDTFIQYHGAATASYNDTPTFLDDIVYESYLKVTATAHNILFGTSDEAGTGGDCFQVQTYNVSNLRYFYSKNDGTSTSVSEAPDFPIDTYVRVKLTFDGTNAHAYVDADEISTGSSTHLPNENMGLWLFVSGGTIVQDWSWIRKYNSPEPAFSSAGSEETPPTGAAPTGVFYGPLVGPLGGPL